ncbi:type II toxin-antitoxin system PemK/MazF family toxin [Paenibacillus larvae]
MTVIPDRGDIVYMDFNPQSGHEQAGWRPALVLSPKLFNATTNLAVVCPITSRVKNYLFEVHLPDIMKTKGVILVHQLKSADWRSRKLEIREKAPQEIIDEVIEKIHTFL